MEKEDVYLSIKHIPEKQGYSYDIFRCTRLKEHTNEEKAIHQGEINGKGFPLDYIQNFIEIFNRYNVKKSKTRINGVEIFNNSDIERIIENENSSDKEIIQAIYGLFYAYNTH